MDIVDEYTARWTGDGYPEGTFKVHIARLDKPEYRAYWDSLSEAEQEQYDDTVFYYVYDEKEIQQLHQPDFQDFQLLDDDYCNCGDCSDTPIEQRPAPIDSTSQEED